MGLYAAGGLLKHAPAILAFAAPTTNSYRRLVPGFEAPVNLALSARNRSASIRIPMNSKSPKAKRMEFRCPDPSCNGYLAWPAMLMAMIDGIQNKIDPGKPLDRDIYEMTRDEMREMGIRTTPGSLEDDRRPRKGPCVPDARGRVHRRPRANVDRLQAGEGTRSDAPAAASARVLYVLRQLARPPDSQLPARAFTAVDPPGALPCFLPGNTVLVFGRQEIRGVPDQALPPGNRRA